MGGCFCRLWLYNIRAFNGDDDKYEKEDNDDQNKDDDEEEDMDE